MAERKKYRKRELSRVTAVQLDLATPGFTYQKWGHEQHCKAQDWIVNNDGDVYTVDRESFAKTYRAVSPGVYEKFGPVWAEVAEQDGAISTKEGSTASKAGDYLVFNDEDGTDGYAIAKKSFEEMYEPAE
jgi:hypothetical protein